MAGAAIELLVQREKHDDNSSNLICRTAIIGASLFLVAWAAQHTFISTAWETYHYGGRLHLLPRAGRGRSTPEKAARPHKA